MREYYNWEIEMDENFFSKTCEYLREEIDGEMQDGLRLLNAANKKLVATIALSKDFEVILRQLNLAYLSAKSGGLEHVAQVKIDDLLQKTLELVSSSSKIAVEANAIEIKTARLEALVRDFLDDIKGHVVSI